MSLREASRRFNISLSTLHRRLKSGDLSAAGAYKDDREWKIPPQALASLGYREIALDVPSETPETPVSTDRLTPHDTTDETPRNTAEPSENQLRSEILRLQDALQEEQMRATKFESELSQAEQRAAIAEAVSDERNRVIEAQAQTLRMLESIAPSAPEQLERKESQETAEDAPYSGRRNKRWSLFSRGRR